MTRDAGLRLPIFELPVAILPGELLPLHIFEERYKRMVAQCLESHEPFGIVLRDDDGGARRVGCTARVAEVVEEFDDGRMDIVVVGELPFQVLDRFEAPDYPEGEISPLDRSPAPAEGDSPAAAAAREAFAQLVERVSGEALDSAELEGQDAYGIAARVELPAETKQLLLEIPAEGDRMRVLGNALRALLAAVERSEEVAERARMNGKVILG